MGFPWTLQRYIFRELWNHFLLAALSIAIVFSLGGGVLNMIRLGAVTPGQFLKLMILVIPVSLALTLPVAALFSASSTYGRLSADNEFVACRSSGINLHVLLVPTLVLSLLAASITFAFSNYAIPSLIGRLNEMVTGDLTTMVAQRLQRSKGVTIAGRYRVYADQCVVDPQSPDHIVLTGVAIVEVDKNDWIRFGTARRIDLFVDREARNVGGTIYGWSLYDQMVGRFIDVDVQPFARTPIPSAVPAKIKFQTLGRLLELHQNPLIWHELTDAVERVRGWLIRKRAYDALVAQWRMHKRFQVGGDDLQYALTSSEAPAEIPRLGGIELRDALIEERRRGRSQTIRAPKVLLEVRLGDDSREAVVQIELRHDSSASTGDAAGRPARMALGPMPIAPDVSESVGRLSGDELLARAQAEATADDPLRAALETARARRRSIIHEIVATAHERIAFSASMFVLVILGATLGIIFRGSHVVTAFAISFLPSLLVMIGIVAGKQMAQNTSTHAAGIGVMWGGIALVGLLDAWVLARALKR